MNRPDSPACLKPDIGPSNLVFSRPTVASVDGSSYGRSPPVRFWSSGLWSKRSICEGPPDMNKKIMRLARAGKWVGLTARGDASPDAESGEAQRHFVKHGADGK